MKISYQPRLNRDMSTAGAIIGGGSSLLGDIFNLFGQSKANREQEAYNTGIMQQQRQWSLQDIAAQNAYNSPAQQMARYKEAGLNPNLIYGEGVQASSGQSDMPRSVPSASYTPQNTLAAFSNLGSQANNVMSTAAELPKTAASTENINTDTNNKMKFGVFQDIKNIEEKSNGRSDPAMSKWFQEVDQDIQGYEEKIKGNKARASDVEPLRASLDFNLIQDQNKRDWAENARRQAMLQPNLNLAIQSLANSVEQNASIKQANQNAAAEFQGIMESTKVKALDAMIKNKELGESDSQKIMGNIIDMIILSKALKK